MANKYAYMLFFSSLCVTTEHVIASENEAVFSKTCTDASKQFREALQQLSTDLDFEVFYSAAKDCEAYIKGTNQINSDNEDLCELASQKDICSIVKQVEACRKETDEQERKKMKEELEQIIGWYGQHIDALIEQCLSEE